VIVTMETEKEGEWGRPGEKYHEDINRNKRR
jgi:hypothetical protein